MRNVVEQTETTPAVRSVEWFSRGQNDWTTAGESPRTELWERLSSPAARRRGVARAFADAIRQLDGIDQMWLTESEKDLEVVAVLTDPSVEETIRNVFIDLMCERLDPSEGELRIFQTGQVPEWAQQGESLN